MCWIKTNYAHQEVQAHIKMWVNSEQFHLLHNDTYEPQGGPIIPNVTTLSPSQHTELAGE